MSSSSGSGQDPYVETLESIELRFKYVQPISTLGWDLAPPNFISIKEPDHFDFQNSDGEMDVYKLMNDPYGTNNYGLAKYYYMHGRWGAFDCLEDNWGQYIDPGDNSVTITLNPNYTQVIWAQIMSQCHSNPNNDVSLSGRGFWYKHEESYSANVLREAVETGLDLYFDRQEAGITECTDYTDQQYGCENWDAGNNPY